MGAGVATAGATEAGTTAAEAATGTLAGGVSAAGVSVTGVAAAEASRAGTAGGVIVIVAMEFVFDGSFAGEWFNSDIFLSKAARAAAWAEALSAGTFEAKAASGGWGEAGTVCKAVVLPVSLLAVLILFVAGLAVTAVTAVEFEFGAANESEE